MKLGYLGTNQAVVVFIIVYEILKFGSVRKVDFFLTLLV